MHGKDSAPRDWHRASAAPDPMARTPVGDAARTPGWPTPYRAFLHGSGRYPTLDGLPPLEQIPLDPNKTLARWIGIAGGNLRPFWTAGARTDAADLPAGTATYVGSMGAEALSQVGSSNIVRYTLRGELSLTADFDASTLEGEITNIDQRWREPRPRVWIDLPGTTRFDITDGQIADGQFTATLTGVDRNESAPLHESVRGYEGDVLGEFYGPAAEEVGGVISATRDADLRVMGGTIRGHQQ